MSIYIGDNFKTLNNLVPRIDQPSLWPNSFSESHTIGSDGEVTVTATGNYGSYSTPYNYSLHAGDLVYMRMECYSRENAENRMAALTFEKESTYESISVSCYGRDTVSDIVSVPLTASYQVFLRPPLSTGGAAMSWSVATWYKCVAVNLTETFGAGNEPTKAWCDANIPDFYGTTVITVASVAHRIAGAYVGDSASNARKVVKCYIGDEHDIARRVGKSVSLTNLYNPATATYGTNRASFNGATGIVIFVSDRDSHRDTSPNIAATSGHIYYGRATYSIPQGTTVQDGRFEIYYSDAAGRFATLARVSAALGHADWHTSSGIGTVTYTASSYRIRNFAICSKAVQGKDFMVLDLTEAFGAGHEPSKEWCDANIPNFYGTYTINIL